MNNDALRALVVALVSQGLNVLVLLKLVSLGQEQLGSINVFAGLLITLIFFLWKPSPTPPEPLPPTWTPPPTDITERRA